MKLQNKFILVLLTAVLGTFFAAQIVQGTMSHNALAGFSGENLAQLEQREQVHAENIYQTIHPVVETTIGMGEMQKLDALLKSYEHIDGLLEYSIYDAKGIASYSTRPELVKAKKPLSEDLKGSLLASPAKLSRNTAEAFEVFQPITVTAKCVECHDTFKAGTVGGVAVLRLSKNSLVQARQRATAALGQMEQTTTMNFIFTTLAIAAVVIILTWWSVRRLITRPLTGIMQRLNLGSEQLELSSAQITAASQALAEGATEQATSLEESSSSLEEMASMTKQNAEHALQVDELAKETRSAAERGAADMKQMSAAMEATKASSREIAKIIKTIDEIAFQTNILALNASVEAARAGEAGLGFAVVADEVRSLAQRCASAARETSEKIEDAIGKTNYGAEITAKVETALGQIVESARQVDTLAAEVANACVEESQGIKQINSAVGRIESVTQANSSQAEETARSAEELNAQAESMEATVAELVAMLGGEQAQKSIGAQFSRTSPRKSAVIFDSEQPSRPATKKQLNESKLAA